MIKCSDPTCKVVDVSKYQACRLTLGYILRLVTCTILCGASRPNDSGVSIHAALNGQRITVRYATSRLRRSRNLRSSSSGHGRTAAIYEGDHGTQLSSLVGVIPLRGVGMVHHDIPAQYLEDFVGEYLPPHGTL